MKLLLCLFIGWSAVAQPMQLPTGYDMTDVTVLHKNGFTVGYSCRRAGPLWVSWHLSVADLGPTRRYAGGFYPDKTIPTGCYRAQPIRYARSGYDLGHLCPAADRTGSDSINRETFVLSNVTPQTAALNRRTWKQVEDYERKLARTGYQCVIYAGVADSLGTLAGKITVPAYCWKLIIATRQGGNRPKTRVVAIWMPNTARVARYRWAHYRVSVADIEQRTGLVFGVLPIAR